MTTADQDVITYFEQNLPALTAELAKQSVTGVGKLAQVVMSGSLEVVSVTLDASVVDAKVKAEVEAAIMAAFADAKKQAMAMAAKQLQPPNFKPS